MSERLRVYLSYPISSLSASEATRMQKVVASVRRALDAAGVIVRAPEIDVKAQVDAAVSREVRRRRLSELRESDLLVAIVGLRSTGVGMELREAAHAPTPSVLVRLAGDAPSAMTLGFSPFLGELWYHDRLTFEAELESLVHSVRPRLLTFQKLLSTHELTRQIGDNVRRARARRGYSRKALADTLHPYVSEDALREIERGRWIPSIQLLILIAKQLKVEYLALLDRRLAHHSEPLAITSQLSDFASDIGLSHKGFGQLAHRVDHDPHYHGRPLTDDEMWEIVRLACPDEYRRITADIGGNRAF